MSENKYKDRIEYLRKLKDNKERLNEQLKAINTEIEQYEREIIDEMETDGVDKVSITGVGTASVTVKDYPQVEDMDAFVAWCYENGRSDMIQKRVSSTAYNQYVQEENLLPDGTKVYTKSTLSFRRS